MASTVSKSEERVIQFNSVSKYYAENLVIDKLDLCIAEKELCVLVGPSGSGKSTVLRMINHLVVPDSGTITLMGKPLLSWKPEDLRRGIGYVIQSVGLFPHMTVETNVGIVPDLLRWKKDRIRVRTEELLTLVGLDPSMYRSRYPHELSGGEAQRIGVARALAADPAILLMDEPFSAVDPLTRMSLQTEFLAIQKQLKKTIVFVTHDVDEAIRLADRVVLLRDGKLVQYDTPEQVLEQPANAFISDFFGADRALKRLSRFKIEGYIHPPPHAFLGESLGESSAFPDRFLWIVDKGGRLIGSVDRERLSGEPIITRDLVSTNVVEMALRPEVSLKDALSTMIGTGARNLPVVDRDFNLVGQISLADIEEASKKIS